jgi:tRNA modification GTPase
MTIFALASGAGRAAIAVLRLSGGQTGAILTALCGTLPPPRRASVRTLRHQGEILDQALVLWFPDARAYTGEPSGELHLHGGRAVLEAVSEALVDLGARPAEPGEFSRRAFLNGRMDLLQAEAVADLVAAETDGQRRQALRQLGGALGALYGEWSDTLRRLLAWQEAEIDFSTEDLPGDLERRVLADIVDLRDRLAAHLAESRRAERLRDGLVFVVSGPPNVGKSSLLNALVERDAAIVSARPGTTRDAIEARVEFAGVPVTLVDTAGLREAADEIEQEGIRRAERYRAGADLVIEVREPGAGWPGDGLAVMNKADLLPVGEASAGWLLVSAVSGEGVAALRARLTQEAAALAGPGSAPSFTRARHRAAIEAAHAALGAALSAGFVDLRAEELRLAMRALGRVTGAVGVEDLLDTVFCSFCIGK